jgi:hypothetical protein
MQHLHSPWQTCRGPCRVSLRVSVSLIMYHNARTTSPRCCQETFLFTIGQHNPLFQKMTIYSGFTHQKWWFFIVMLVYQRETSGKTVNMHLTQRHCDERLLAFRFLWMSTRWLGRLWQGGLPTCWSSVCLNFGRRTTGQQQWVSFVQA